MCLRRVAFKRKGLEVTPNTTRVTLYFTILGYAEFISSTQRKCRMFLSSLTAITRKAFSMSATSAIGWTLNLMRISRMSRARGGPVWRQSFNTGPFPLADTLYTMRSLVVDFLLSRRSDGEGNVSDDKAGHSRISFCLCYKVSGLNEQHCQNNRGTLATPSVDH